MQKAFKQTKSIELSEMNSASYLNTTNPTAVAAVEHREGNLEETPSLWKNAFSVVTIANQGTLVQPKKLFIEGMARKDIIKDSANLDLHTLLQKL